MPPTSFAVHTSWNLDAFHSSCVLLLRDAIMGHSGTWEILWDEEDMETSLCPPYTPSCHSCCLKNPRTLSRAQNLPICPQMELAGAEPKTSFLSMEGPYKHNPSCCRYSVMVIESVLLRFSWLWRSHRRTLETTTALWTAAFTLPKPPEIVLEGFFDCCLGVLPLKKPPLKIISHFLHSIKQLLATCLTSGDCQRFFSFRLF